MYVHVGAHKIYMKHGITSLQYWVDLDFEKNIGLRGFKNCNINDSDLGWNKNSCESVCDDSIS